jgi:hypothetical protein
MLRCWCPECDSLSDALMGTGELYPYSKPKNYGYGVRLCP